MKRINAGIAEFCARIAGELGGKFLHFFLLYGLVLVIFSGFGSLAQFLALVISGGSCLDAYGGFSFRFRDKFQDYIKHLIGSEADLKGGIVFGRYMSREQPLVERKGDEEGHCIIVGGPGSGKTSGVVIPTLLRFQDCGVLAVDVKGELSDITKKSRKKVFVFDPERGGHAYDPLRECKTVNGAQDLARTLIPVPQSGDAIWANAAQGIFSAAVLEGAHTGQTICSVAKRVCLTDSATLIAELQASPVQGVQILSSVGVGMPEKTLGGVMAELRSRLLTLASDEQIARATSKSDFTPASLEQGASIYLRVKEHLLDQYRDLWTVMFNQFIRHLEQRPERAHPPILLLLDELPRLGYISKLQGAMATLRSRNVSILGVVQSLAQLDQIYGRETRKIMMDNFAYKLVLACGDAESQRYFSDLAGKVDKWKYGESVSYNDEGEFTGRSLSRNQERVDWIEPDKWARLDNPILFSPGVRPFELKKAAWHSDPYFLSKAGALQTKTKKNTKITIMR